MNKLIKIFPVALLALSVSATSKAEVNYGDMHKQLNIMSDIIKSSVGDQKDRKNSSISGIESTYLSGQGIIFTISSGSRSRNWGNYNFNFVMPELPVMPVMPIAPLKDRDNEDDRFENDINESVSNALESASQRYERAIEAMDQDREQFRELRDEQRDLNHEIRDLEREKRDLEYQIRRADQNSKLEMTKKIKQLEQKRIEIEKGRAVLSEKSQELQKQQQSQRAEQAKERVAFYKKLTTSLAETLCLYGNGLKALPKNEYISLIVKSAGDKEDHRYKDQIFVYSKSDVSDCSADKINVAKLLDKSKKYQF